MGLGRQSGIISIYLTASDKGYVMTDSISSANDIIEIFIVDALLESAHNIQKMLALEGDFKVVGIATTGAQALEALQTLKPHVILIDLALSDGDGFSLSAQLTRQFPTIAVVMMSTTSDGETLKQAMLSGARDFLEKPVDIKQLYDTIRRVYQAFAPIRRSYPLSSVELKDTRYRSSAQLEETRKEDVEPDLPMLPSLPTPISPITPLLDETDSDESGSFEKLDDFSPESDLSVRPSPPPPLPRPSKPITPITPPPAVQLPELVPLPTPIAPITPPSLEEEIALKPIFFSAYYPREAKIERKNGLYVYAHLEDALAAIQKDVEKFKEELGGSVPQPRTAKQSAQIAENTPITLIPESDTLQFEPKSLTKRWREPFTRFDFDFFPSADLVDETAFVRVSVQIGGIEIASIKCGIEVVEAKAIPVSLPITDENPLVSARFATQQAETYRKIFISYSRKDSQVARAYQMAQLAMGNEVFLDIDSLRAGENWQAALARAIDSADIFQMFWSSSYAESEYCRYEWDYALRYRCPDQKCEGFIRPVYWVNPMVVAPPAELGHLNFKYVPFMTEGGED